jgi:beta-lactam-binding protein with PASTA domain
MVPSVVTLPSVDAKGLVESAEFPVSLEYREEGEGELGTIVLQEPSSGRRIALKETITIYERSRLVVVPSVLKMSLGAAKDSLLKVGLKVTEAGESYTGQTEPYMVNTQNPIAGKFAAEGSSVELTLEGIPATVPNITNMSVEEAKIALGSSLELKISRTNYDIGYTGEPKVISQVPPATTKVLAGSAVTVVRQAQGFEVPDVVKMTSAKATETLSATGLEIGPSVQKKSGRPLGEVIAQNPKAGKVIGKDEKVILTVSNGNN